MGFFGEKMFGKKPAPAAEKVAQEVKNEASESKNEETSEKAENLEKGESEKSAEAPKAEEGEKKPEGPVSFEMSPALSGSLDKLVKACSSGSPMDVEGALMACENAISAYKGKRFQDSDASISALTSMQNAINSTNKNFFLGASKGTVMLRIGMLEKKINNLLG